MTKEKYAELLNLIPHEAMQILKDEADAERLVVYSYPQERAKNHIATHMAFYWTFADDYGIQKYRSRQWKSHYRWKK